MRLFRFQESIPEFGQSGGTLQQAVELDGISIGEEQGGGTLQVEELEGGRMGGVPELDVPVRVSGMIEEQLVIGSLCCGSISETSAPLLLSV